MLGTKLRSSTRVVPALNRFTISPDSIYCFFNVLTFTTFNLESYAWAGEKVQQVKALSAKPDDLHL